MGARIRSSELEFEDRIAPALAQLVSALQGNKTLSDTRALGEAERALEIDVGRDRSRIVAAQGFCHGALGTLRVLSSREGEMEPGRTLTSQ